MSESPGDCTASKQDEKARQPVSSVRAVRWSCGELDVSLYGIDELITLGHEFTPVLDEACGSFCLHGETLRQIAMFADQFGSPIAHRCVAEPW